MRNNNFLQLDEYWGLGLKSIGKDVLISRNVEFINPGKISIGDNTRIDSFSVLCAGPEGIEIGSHVHISTHVTIVGRGKVTIEDFVGLSSGVKIFSSSDDYSGLYLTNPCVPDEYKQTNHSHIFIGRHGVIGAGAVLLPGTWLGLNCAVGALSLVNKNFGPSVIIAGVPAVWKKNRDTKILELEKLFYDEYKQSGNVDYDSGTHPVNYYGETPYPGPFGPSPFSNKNPESFTKMIEAHLKAFPNSSVWVPNWNDPEYLKQMETMLSNIEKNQEKTKINMSSTNLRFVENSVEPADESLHKALNVGGGLRLNNGKVRYDLLEPFAQQQKAQIFTKGARKYAPNNWLNGMDWTKCYESALRHQAAWMRGEDYDTDPTCPTCKESTKDNWICKNHTGELHSALAAWNWDAITSYYRWYPQGDNRLSLKNRDYKIGLDLDDVIISWVKPWCEKHLIDIPTDWHFQWGLPEIFAELKKTGELDKFYLSLPPLIKPEEIPFEVDCYISHRPVGDEISKAWLRSHGFPLKPVFHVKERADKVKIAKERKLDFFVDDSYATFKAMNAAGICCYLMNARHNEKFEVGYRRIYHLNELPV